MKVRMINTTDMKGDRVKHLAKGERRNFRKASFTLHIHSGSLNIDIALALRLATKATTSTLPKYHSNRYRNNTFQDFTTQKWTNIVQTHFFVIFRKVDFRKFLCKYMYSGRRHKTKLKKSHFATPPMF